MGEWRTKKLWAKQIESIKLPYVIKSQFHGCRFPSIQLTFDMTVYVNPRAATQLNIMINLYESCSNL